MPKSKLLEQVRDKIRTRGYSIRTETAYITWIGTIAGAFCQNISVFVEEVDVESVSSCACAISGMNDNTTTALAMTPLSMIPLLST